MFVSLLHVHVHVNVHVACSYPCCISLSSDQAACTDMHCPSPCQCLVSISMLNVRVHGSAASPCPCCMSIAMLKVHAYNACLLSMLHVHCPCARQCPCGDNFQAAYPCCASMLCAHAAWTSTKIRTHKVMNIKKGT
jgi:hypothetical protein